MQVVNGTFCVLLKTYDLTGNIHSWCDFMSAISIFHMNLDVPLPRYYEKLFNMLNALHVLDSKRRIIFIIVIVFFVSYLKLLYVRVEMQPRSNAFVLVAK